MSETKEPSRLPSDPAKADDNRTLNDANLSDTLTNLTKTQEEVGAGGDSVVRKDSDSVSVTSDSPSEKKGGASVRPSGIKPPSRISRPCAGAQKPGLPVTPPSKSESVFIYFFCCLPCELFLLLMMSVLRRSGRIKVHFKCKYLDQSILVNVVSVIVYLHVVFAYINN